MRLTPRKNWNSKPFAQSAVHRHARRRACGRARVPSAEFRETILVQPVRLPQLPGLDADPIALFRFDDFARSRPC